MKSRFAVVLLASLVVGCASAKLPPKASPEEVKLFEPDRGVYPDPGYKTIGPVKVERDVGTSEKDLLLALRGEAAKLGADAVVLSRIRNSVDDPGMATSVKPRLVAEGLAIYWPK